MAEIPKASPASYDDAIARLKKGEAVALPTETVYGLAALAADDEAVANVYKIKSRPHSKPFSIVVGSIEAAENVATLSPLAKQLAEAFWPGPLTLVLPLNKYAAISPLALSNNDTIGIRCPDIAWMTHFAKTGFSAPLVLPSANTSGKPAPTTAAGVDQDIGDKISTIVDGGHCKTGIESTIIAIKEDKARLLRHGAIPPESFAPFDMIWITE